MSDPPMSWTLHTYYIKCYIINAECKAILADTRWQIFVNIHFQLIYIDLSNNFDSCVSALYHENGQI